MELYAFLVAFAIQPDANRLGADDFQTREDATDRLKLWGWLARPELLKLRASTDDPEVLYRVRAIIGHQDALVKKLQRAAILHVDYWPEEGFWDEGNRLAAWEELKRLNMPTWWPSGHPREWDGGAPWRLHPGYDNYAGRATCNKSLTTHERCNMAAYNVRLYLGIRPAAPMPKVK